VPVKSGLLVRIDNYQQSKVPLAFLGGVISKYVDDRASSLSALVTFYGFLAVFPLMLLFVTVVSFVVGTDKHLEKQIIDSALRDFPIIGPQLRTNIHGLSDRNPFAFVVSFLVLLWGALGVTNTIQRASATVWGIARDAEAKLASRALRGLALLGLIGAAVVLSTVLAGAASIGSSALGLHGEPRVILTFVAALIVNVAAYMATFKILARPGRTWRTFWLGALIGGVGWTLLQTLGGFLVAHVLRHSTELYGFFAIVLGLIFWLNLGSRLFIFSSEVNVVRANGLWPRSLLTRAESDEEDRSTPDT
jgi:YihY family inner membrane protein